ncbi:DUF3617 family protein [Sphingomonas colocasiae]|uniref:DUF3617 family protein n=1 Tax=Sphingomonas colocasiae TaxID=1848973 RepID=A0ABS7PR21_9SPHN|nr:DUF3617 family protein [Sphingomonas colocasiae]MBY8823790.1 DUF3617 family protein [Sphingomonas colocasiae]
MRAHLAFCVGLAVAGIASTDAAGQVSTRKEDLAGVMGLRIGGWHTKLQITAADLVPLEKGSTAMSTARSKLRERIGMPFDTDDCIGRGLDKAGRLILPGIAVDGACTFNRVEARGGRFKLNVTCGDDAVGFATNLDIEGAYSGNAMNARIDTKSSSKKAGYLTTTTIETTSRYSGLCMLVQSPTPKR